MKKLRHPPKWHPNAFKSKDDTFVKSLLKFQLRMTIGEKQNGDTDIWVTDLQNRKCYHFLAEKEVNLVNIKTLIEINNYIRRVHKEENLSNDAIRRRNYRIEKSDKREQRSLSHDQRLQQRAHRHDGKSRPLIVSTILSQMHKSTKTTK